MLTVVEWCQTTEISDDGDNDDDCMMIVKWLTVKPSKTKKWHVGHHDHVCQTTEVTDGDVYDNNCHTGF